MAELLRIFMDKNPQFIYMYVMEQQLLSVPYLQVALRLDDINNKSLSW